jgi:TPR repeat protein
MHRDSVGGTSDQAQAAELFRKAAEQGHPQAQGNLGNFYFLGRGVAQDYVEAHKWLNIAGASLEGQERKECVELRDRVAGVMTPAQLAEAQKRAVAWSEAYRQRRR